MFIATAYAQDAGAEGGGLMVQMLPLVLIFVVFYFLLIRPQQKKAKSHREMVGNLQRGDKVVTAGGLYATVAKVEDQNTVVLEIANGVRVKAARGTISELAAKTEPRRGSDDNGGKKDKKGKSDES
ncbi:MAG: preprotein translocase subunit YajC [Alphaproteobacteria bacterium]|jgi:preprotein translocase subunit YajC|nr:preprotein translocase subunit YajC [Alphaproteobacteria bacterium]MDP6517990.1 preprotein translocase subunit YajC [Alphaproteobacteria bacterium]